MVHTEFPYSLYLVISEADCRGRDFLNVAQQAIRGGVDIIQLREKNLTTAAYLEKAKRIKEITDRYSVPLIINDNLAVAMQVESAGIHVGNSDMAPIQIAMEWTQPRKVIGYSIEYLDQLSNAQTAVANHLGVSPVFSTATKTNTVTEWGLEGLSRIRSLTSKPLVAIGNMKLDNVKSVVAAGANSIAVVSAICDAENPEKVAYELKNEIIR